jgi:response regulator RpfG family c-di-GMP phosphodiesterase
MTGAHAPTVLVLDDDAASREYLGEALTASGCVCNSFGDTAAALSYLASAQDPPDLVLSDINMPGMTGLDFLRTVRAVTLDLPFILISGWCELSTAQDAMRSGATDYLLKPTRREDVARLVAKYIDGPRIPNPDVTVTALSGFLNARRLASGDPASQLAPLMEMLGLRRLETLQHSLRVSGFSRMIGLEMGLDAHYLEVLEIAALLHDIGKAGIPHNVLLKPASLNEQERRIMRMHPFLGWELLNRTLGTRYEAEIVYAHHEHFNGDGYPRGLRQEEIPIGARAFTVADTLDAILSDRPYRRAQTLIAARQEISRLSGIQFDPKVVDCFARIPDDKIELLRDRHQDKAESDS